MIINNNNYRFFFSKPLVSLSISKRWASRASKKCIPTYSPTFKKDYFNASHRKLNSDNNSCSSSSSQNSLRESRVKELDINKHKSPLSQLSSSNSSIPLSLIPSKSSIPSVSSVSHKSSIPPVSSPEKVKESVSNSPVSISPSPLSPVSPYLSMSGGFSKRGGTSLGGSRGIGSGSGFKKDDDKFRRNISTSSCFQPQNGASKVIIKGQIVDYNLGKIKKIAPRFPGDKLQGHPCFMLRISGKVTIIPATHSKNIPNHQNPTLNDTGQLVYEDKTTTPSTFRDLSGKALKQYIQRSRVLTLQEEKNADFKIIKVDPVVENEGKVKIIDNENQGKTLGP